MWWVVKRRRFIALIFPQVTPISQFLHKICLNFYYLSKLGANLECYKESSLFWLVYFPWCHVESFSSSRNYNNTSLTIFLQNVGSICNDNKIILVIIISKLSKLLNHTKDCFSSQHTIKGNLLVSSDLFPQALARNNLFSTSHTSPYALHTLKRFQGA